MMNQLSLSVAHSGRMLFSFISCFILSIHLSLGLPLGRDPGTWVARTYFAILCSSLLWTWPNQDNRFFVRKVFIGCTWAFSRMVVFLIWSFLVFPCIHLNIFISVVFIRLWSLFRIGQHSPPYVIAGLIAVLYILFFNASMKIATMWCCIMLKIGFHIGMNVGFSKQFRFSRIMLWKENTCSMQLIICEYKQGELLF